MVKSDSGKPGLGRPCHLPPRRRLAGCGKTNGRGFAGALPRPFVWLGANAPGAPAGSRAPCTRYREIGMGCHDRSCGAPIGSRSRSAQQRQIPALPWPCCFRGGRIAAKTKDAGAAARAGRLREAPATSRSENQRRRRGGPRRTLAGGAGNIAPRKPTRGVRGDLFPRLSFVFPHPARATVPGIRGSAGSRCCPGRRAWAWSGVRPRR